MADGAGPAAAPSAKEVDLIRLVTRNTQRETLALHDADEVFPVKAESELFYSASQAHLLPVLGTRYRGGPAEAKEHIVGWERARAKMVRVLGGKWRGSTKRTLACDDESCPVKYLLRVRGGSFMLVRMHSSHKTTCSSKRPKGSVKQAVEATRRAVPRQVEKALEGKGKALT
jgi:hypothetical protein